MHIHWNSAHRRWLLGISLIFLFILLPWKISLWRYSHQIHLPQTTPSRRWGIVFGAGLRRDGKPSDVLSDRVTIAAKLYHVGKISKILMSGSSYNLHYNEPSAMRQLAIQHGVNPDDIVIDTGGLRTFETCRRAKQLFDIRSALLVSQRFHLPRALGICEALGIEAIGVSADIQRYGTLSTILWQLREIPATFVALWDIALIPLLDSQIRQA